MLVRFAAIVALSASLSACAQSPMVIAPGFDTGSLQAVPSASANGIYDQRQNLGRPTLAGKVLTAIALERVTGRKPDPESFSDLD